MEFPAETRGTPRPWDKDSCHLSSLHCHLTGPYIELTPIAGPRSTALSIHANYPAQNMIRSLLSVVQAANNLPEHPNSPYPTVSPDGTERYVPFHHTFADFQAGLPPIGLLRPAVVRELQSQGDDPTERQDSGTGAPEQNVWQFFLTTSIREDGSGNGVKRQRGGEETEGSVPSTASTTDGGEALDAQVECVFLSDWVLSGGPERISSVLAGVVGKWREAGKFPGPLAGTFLFPLSSIFVLYKAACPVNRQ